MPELVMPLRAVDARAAGSRVIVLPDGADAPGLAPWQTLSETAGEAVLVIDAAHRLRSASATARALLGCRGDVEGQDLLDVVALVDFETGRPHPEYAERIPPLVVLRHGGLARSLVRVRDGEQRRTLDIASSAVLVDGDIVGSVSLLAAVTPR